MDFCEKCNAVMVSKQKDGKTVLVCRICGHTEKNYKPTEIAEQVKKNPADEIIIIEKNAETLPITKASCPKCGNTEALWWVQQTRSADEAPTLFLRCTECKHSWREYG